MDSPIVRAVFSFVGVFVWIGTDKKYPKTWNLQRLGFSWLVKRLLSQPSPPPVDGKYPPRQKRRAPAPPHDITIEQVLVPRVALPGLDKNPIAEPMEAEWIASAKCNDASPVVLWSHGGAYVVGEKEMARQHVYGLARAGIKTLSIEYRLAPENTYPDALLDAYSGYQYLLKQGVKPERIVIAGESAGGGLTLSLAIYLRDHGVQLPAGITVFSPWVDLTHSTPTMYIAHEFACDILPQLPKEGRAGAHPAAKYTGVDKYAERRMVPTVSPLFDGEKGLPPQLITTGTHDRLLAESIAYALTRQDRGDVVQLEIYENQPHVFQLFDCKPTQTSYARLLEFVTTVTEGKDVQPSATELSDPRSGPVIATSVPFSNIRDRLAKLMERATKDAPWAVERAKSGEGGSGGGWKVYVEAAGVKEK
ncbi:hypothetical protein M427DRAFT_155070 [Gonapodya prolifera JEL478]|uniref:Alpha/beta hydrolase fold-3 domain-containing protein n=1 Tax=Gonapodya prolifera (strain JEL478) TaxID=1344416 RepID=A0A139AHM3_GONPJ|nr:hypothetical protein M427DRAFT_155070 [Gonapodya prolifera JEL478]|eukprot:KXS16054.1 hypothetical protein M427DRAFT_155070 [Gonapodya prolifera JEL478]